MRRAGIAAVEGRGMRRWREGERGVFGPPAMAPPRRWKVVGGGRVGE